VDIIEKKKKTILLLFSAYFHNVFLLQQLYLELYLYFNALNYQYKLFMESLYI